MEKKLKYIFAVLSVGLSLISLKSGFNAYQETIQDLTMTILAIFVFEALRLSMLYPLVWWEFRRKMIALPLYLLISFICGAASTTSFFNEIEHSRLAIIEVRNNELDRRIGSIKQNYAVVYKKELIKVDNEKDQLNQKIIAKPWIQSYKKNLELSSQKHDLLITERDSLLSYWPQNDKEEWISHHAAILGLTFEPLPVANIGSSMARAIQELFGVTFYTAQKFVAITLTLGIEFGILILAIFSSFCTKPRSKNKPKKIRQVTWTGNGIIKELNNKYGREVIVKFVDKAYPFFLEQGRLPSTSGLNKNLRSIRSFVAQNIKPEDLGQFLASLRNGKGK